jgi:hypothetical protein
MAVLAIGANETTGSSVPWNAMTGTGTDEQSLKKVAPATGPIAAIRSGMLQASWEDMNAPFESPDE